MDKLLDKAVETILSSGYISVFTGAGISVESGIPPFRGENGLWSKYDPKILDLQYFYQNPEKCWNLIKKLFYDFIIDAKPNIAHKILSQMEEKGYIHSIITQNIDNLHQKAGSKKVYEFHGTAATLICQSCGLRHNKNFNKLLDILPPSCRECYGLLKPDFIFFGENIPQEIYKKSFIEAEKSDTLIIIGTTGEVQPASLIPIMAKQNQATIIEINKERSHYTDRITDIFLQGKAGDILLNISKKLKLN